MDEIPIPKSIVTATVTPPDPTLPVGVDLHMIGALVREIAMNMHDLPVILERNQFTEQQYEHLCKNPNFIKIRDNAILEWAALSSTQQRLAMEAAVGIEVSMPSLITRLQDTKEPLVAVVQGFKMLSDMAGINAQKGPEGVGEKFSITINLGGGKTEAITVESQPAPLPEDAQGASDQIEVFALPSPPQQPPEVRPVESGTGPEKAIQSFGFGEVEKT